MGSPVRDSQRGKAYKAERVLDDPKFSGPLPTVQNIEAYVSLIGLKAPLRKRYGSALDLKRYPIRVGDGRGTRSAFAHGSHKITIPTWARSEWIVLHEVAHIVHTRLYSGWTNGSRAKELGDPNAAWHGWQWASVYLDLVRFVKGKEAHDALKESFRKHKVRFRPKRAGKPGVNPFKPRDLDAEAKLRVEGESTEEGFFDE
jgi:hypothetical protein